MLIYNTSLMTIRRVLDELYREGAIRSIPGKGIFVGNKTLSNEYGTLIGFETQMARLGFHPQSKTLEARIIPASTMLAQMLKVIPGSPVVYVYRLRYADGIPMSLYKVYLPHLLCPAFWKKGCQKDPCSQFYATSTIFVSWEAGTLFLPSSRMRKRKDIWI